MDAFWTLDRIPSSNFTRHARGGVCLSARFIRFSKSNETRNESKALRGALRIAAFSSTGPLLRFGKH